MIKKEHFTEKDFTTILHKPIFFVGLDVMYRGFAGKIIKTIGNNGDDYCQIELSVSDEHGCKIIEVRKSIFYYSYPLHDK